MVRRPTMKHNLCTRAGTFLASPSSGATVYMICGQQGAGKTTLARALAHDLPAVRFSLDEWIVALFGEQLPGALSRAWWEKHAELCSGVIWSTCRQLLLVGVSVVLDFGFGSQAHRSEYFERAREAKVATKLYVVTADRGTRLERVRARNRHRPPTFALLVTDAMFDHFSFEPLTARERRNAVLMST